MSPLEKMMAVAAAADVDVFDVTAEEGEEFAGAVAVGFNDRDELCGLVGLVKDLDEELKMDVLAFGIAVFAGETERITSTRSGSLGISRSRLPLESKGAGHLAWHMVRSCGRISPSTNFELVNLDATETSDDIAA